MWEQIHSVPVQVVEKALRFDFSDLPSDLDFARLYVGDTEVMALVDTGASASLIDERIYSELLRSDPSKIDEITLLNTAYANGAFRGNRGSILGFSGLKFSFDKVKEFYIPFYVIKDLSFHIFFGNNILKALKISIHGHRGLCESEAFSIHFPLIPCKNFKKTSKSNELALQNLVIKQETPDEIRGVLFPQIDEAHELGTLNKKQVDEWKKMLDGYLTVFSDIVLGRMKDREAELEVQEGMPWEPIKSYPINHGDLPAVRERLTFEVHNDIIEPSTSEYVCPILVVKKKNGGIRVCIDARPINKILKNVHYEPPRIHDILLKAGDDGIITTFDCAQGFLQLPLALGSRKFLAFHVEGRTYQYIRLAFGTKVSPALFIKNTLEILDPAMAGHSDTTVYVDDIQIISSDPDTHLERVRGVLDCLMQGGMKLSLKKTQLCKRSLEYVGFVLGRGIVAKSVLKFKLFEEYERCYFHNRKGERLEIPFKITRQGIQQLLGAVQWYSMFIVNFSEKCRIFNKSIAGDSDNKTRVDWTEEHQKSYEILKADYCCDRFLHKLRPTCKRLEIQVTLATPGYSAKQPDTLGAALLQRDPESGASNLVYLVSTTLNEAQKNYPLQEKEMYAAYFVIDKFRSVLYGKEVHFPASFRDSVAQAACKSQYHRMYGKWVMLLNCFDLHFDLKPFTKTQWQLLEHHSTIEVQQFQIEFNNTEAVQPVDIPPLVLFKNLKNNCALNSAFQTLINIRPLVSRLANGVHHCQEESCFTCFLKKLVGELKAVEDFSVFDLIQRAEVPVFLERVNVTGALRDVVKGEDTDGGQVLSELFGLLVREGHVNSDLFCVQKLIQISHGTGSQTLSFERADSSKEVQLVLDDGSSAYFLFVELERALNCYMNSDDSSRGGLPAMDWSYLSFSSIPVELPEVLRVCIAKDEESTVVVPVTLQLKLNGRYVGYVLSSAVMFKKLKGGSGHFYNIVRHKNLYKVCNDAISEDLEIRNNEIEDRGFRYLIYEKIENFAPLESVCSVYLPDCVSRLEVNDESERSENELVEGIFSVNYFDVQPTTEVEQGLKNIETHQGNDPFCQRTTVAYLKGKLRALDSYKVVDGILYKRTPSAEGDGLVVVLPEHLVSSILAYLHRFYGHPGAEKLYLICQWWFFWNNMSRSIRTFVSACNDCKCNKPSNQSVVPEFAQIVRNNEKGGLVTFDYLGPLPKSVGQAQYVLCAKDAGTGYFWARATKTATAENAVVLLRQIVQFSKKHGVKIKRVLSDNGVQFRSRLWENTCKELGIRYHFTTTYNPKANPTERVIRDFSTKLRLYLNAGRDEDHHAGWMRAFGDTVKILNDCPDKNGSTPNHKWGISSPEVPFALPRILPDLVGLMEKCKEDIDGFELVSDNRSFIYDHNDSVMVYTDGACVRNGTEEAVGGIGVWFGSRIKYF